MSKFEMKMKNFMRAFITLVIK